MWNRESGRMTRAQKRWRTCFEYLCHFHNSQSECRMCVIWRGYEWILYVLMWVVHLHFLFYAENWIKNLCNFSYSFSSVSFVPSENKWNFHRFSTVLNAQVQIVFLFFIYEISACFCLFSFFHSSAILNASSCVVVDSIFATLFSKMFSFTSSSWETFNQEENGRWEIETVADDEIQLKNIVKHNFRVRSDY